MAGYAAWFATQETTDLLHAPVSVYECHLGSWRLVQDAEGGWRPLTYREAAEALPGYLSDLGFTHVEFLPIAEHPFSGSWGYQVTGFYAPTARYGTPDDFRYLVDRLHQAGIGVLVNWVAGHFPKDDWALAHFDGTALYEHADPRLGEHPDWGTLVFNYGRHEVRNFLLANALFWIEEFHVDGLRVDAVASMLYLDYSRKEGEWITNRFGGRENLEAIDFIKECNEVVYRHHPSVMMVAEESTSWPAVSRPTYLGGLGFGFKWNMGWMHDNLVYFAKDPVHRRYHHHELTFALLYAFTENFMLPLSHDEVAHGKGSLLGKMPGDRWQQFANLRALLAWMWAHPGRQLLFMGGEIAQNDEWRHDGSLDWHLLDYPEHAGVHALVRALNTVYRREPALWEQDFDWPGFRWINPNDSEDSVLSFLRFPIAGGRPVACVANLTPVPRRDYRIGLPHSGRWVEILNSDHADFGGSNILTGAVTAEPTGWNDLDYSTALTLPPLSVVMARPRARDRPPRWAEPGDRRLKGQLRVPGPESDRDAGAVAVPDGGCFVVEPYPALGEVAEVQHAAGLHGHRGAAGAVGPPPQRMGEGIPVVEVTHHGHGPARLVNGQGEGDADSAVRSGLGRLDQLFSPLRAHNHLDWGRLSRILCAWSLIPLRKPRRVAGGGTVRLTAPLQHRPATADTESPPRQAGISTNRRHGCARPPCRYRFRSARGGDLRHQDMRLGPRHQRTLPAQQPAQACVAAYTGAAAITNVTMAPRTSDSTPTSTVAPSGAM